MGKTLPIVQEGGKSKLDNGMIPAHTECPFRGRCPEADWRPERNRCNHTGTEHPVPFSCGIARAYNILSA